MYNNIMLIKEQVELIWQMDNICHRCLRAGKYFLALTSNLDNLWAFTQNCYGEITAILWCKLFGAYENNPTHYSHLFKQKELIKLKFSKDFRRDYLKKSI